MVKVTNLSNWKGNQADESQPDYIRYNKYIDSFDEKTGKVNLNMDELRKVNIFFATPCYGGQITDQYFLSMFRTYQKFGELGINHRITTLRNESLVPRARNILTAMFLASDCTHLMFIDADIEFDPESIVRLISMDKDLAVGAYPKKTVNWDAVKKAAQRGEYENLEKYQADYAINLKILDKATGELNFQHSAVELLDASTGFFLIKRKVIEKMTAEYPELHYVNDSNISPEFNKHCYAFFDTGIDPRSGRYLSEDYYFCRLLQKMGGEVWLDTNTKLNHVGSYTFNGEVSRIFGGRQ